MRRRDHSRRNNINTTKIKVAHLHLAAACVLRCSTVGDSKGERVCVFWEEADFSVSSPETRIWACADKIAVRLYQISRLEGCCIPFHSQCGAPWSFGSNQRPSLRLHLQGRTPPRRHVALTADWSVLWFLMLYLLPLTLKKGRLRMERFWYRAAAVCVRMRVDFFFTCISHILSTYQFITRYELKSSITYQCGTYRMYVFHVTVCWCVWFGGRLMCLSPLCCFPSFVSCCCLDRPRLAGDRNKWDC